MHLFWVWWIFSCQYLSSILLWPKNIYLYFILTQNKQAPVLSSVSIKYFWETLWLIVLSIRPRFLSDSPGPEFYGSWNRRLARMRELPRLPDQLLTSLAEPGPECSWCFYSRLWAHPATGAFVVWGDESIVEELGKLPLPAAAEASNTQLFRGSSCTGFNAVWPSALSASAEIWAHPRKRGFQQNTWFRARASESNTA